MAHPDTTWDVDRRSTSSTCKSTSDNTKFKDLDAKCSLNEVSASVQPIRRISSIETDCCKNIELPSATIQNLSRYKCSDLNESAMNPSASNTTKDNFVQIKRKNRKKTVDCQCIVDRWRCPSGKAIYSTYRLYPGDVIYVPKNYWHLVESDCNHGSNTSGAVNFYFKP